MRNRIRSLALAMAIASAACGDGTVIISVNSGVIAGSPFCQGSGGQFELRERGGLEVLVVITSTTRIVVAGGGGSCSDLFAGQPVQVVGHESGDRIVARSITVE
jgi:hypothetical protein